jgi:hypothetical protein
MTTTTGAVPKLCKDCRKLSFVGVVTMEEGRCRNCGIVTLPIAYWTYGFAFPTLQSCQQWIESSPLATDGQFVTIHRATMKNPSEWLDSYLHIKGLVRRSLQ